MPAAVPHGSLTAHSRQPRILGKAAPWYHQLPHREGSGSRFQEDLGLRAAQTKLSRAFQPGSCVWFGRKLFVLCDQVTDRNKRALRDRVNSRVLMSICVVLMSLKIKRSQEELDITCACCNICYKGNSKTFRRSHAVARVSLLLKQ